MMGTKHFFWTFVVSLCTNIICAQSNIRLINEAESFHTQALKEHEFGRDSCAYYLTERSILLLNKCGDENSPLYSECQHDAGMFALMGLNKFDLFLDHMSKASNIKYKLYGYSEEYYWTKECLADGHVYWASKVGFPQEITILETAIKLYESLPQYKKKELYRTALNNLALSYEWIDRRKSIALCEAVLEIKREENVADTLVTLSNLSRFYNDVDYDKALFYGKQVLDARTKLEPLDYDKIRSSYIGLASIYGHKEEFDKAISHSIKARDLAERIYGKNSMEYALSNQNLGFYYFMKGDTLKSLEYTKQAYLNPHGDKQGTAVNLAGIYSSLNEIDSCYKYSKESWLLFCNRYLSEFSRLSEENRFYYACTGVNSGQKALPINYFLQHEEHNGFKKLAFDCILFEKNIIPDCKNKDEQLINSINNNVDSIKSYLGTNDVAIEVWSDKDSILTWDGNIIVAILRKNYDVPLYVKLSKEKIYKALRNEYETTRNYLPLYENIWKEIIEKAHIKEGERLFLSLDDVLSQIPVESICNYDWEYMGDKYDIVRVSSTSRIPQISKKFDISSAALYGGLFYDFTPAFDDKPSFSLKNRSLSGKNIFSEMSDTLTTELRSTTKYLPWTKVEIDSIQAFLSILLINNLKVYQAESGTEESFKLLSGKSPNIIHIATHGFCFQPNEKMDWYEYYKYSMEHSGLLMSGVLTTDTINKDSMIVEDGFLRSTEIAALDLTGTNLLVLSACNTGLGGVTPFGLVGLQRAFKAAGVETMLLTLGDVDDAATCLMMLSFYKFLISGLPKRVAFKKAQQTLRDSEMFKTFNYWGNFILID